MLGVLLVWAYWPTLLEIAQRWARDPQYSHGYLVPIFAVCLLWFRRPAADFSAIVDSRAIALGIALLALGLGLHLFGSRFYHDWFAALSLLPTLAGLCLGLGGWSMLRWAWPSIAFLVFMLPLPYRLEIALAGPLQHLATVASTYVLQTLGLPAVAEGNVIIMKQMRIGVVEACGGLGMLVTFFALATGLALVIRRPLLDKLVVIVSAVPVALIANIGRIVVTALLAENVSKEAASNFFHDLAGWFMVPFALALLWLVLWLFSKLFVANSDAPAYSLPWKV
jgi:exosortase